MLLIDTVKCWTSTRITTTSYSHKNPNNPLCLKGSLSSLHLIEYGAQSIAIHCGLLTHKAQEGFLATVKNAHFYVKTLHDLHSELLIESIAEHQSPQGAVYQLKIQADNLLLFTAQTTVIHR
jgi:predicted hotdog family 3-hydroxylacyl-ACP dehydratase